MVTGAERAKRSLFINLITINEKILLLKEVDKNFIAKLGHPLQSKTHEPDFTCDYGNIAY
jgi:hypothetical protein